MENKFLVWEGIRFDNYSIDGLVDKLFSINQTYFSVVTPNVDHVVQLNRKPELRDIYSDADASVNDSRVLKKMTKLIGIDLGNVIPGSDLTRKIIEKSSGKDIKITIIGCSSETVEYIKKKYNLVNVSHHNPPMGFINDDDEVDKCINFIVDNPSDFIFLCVGFPRQEIIAYKARRAGASGAALCVGASLLFLSGEEKRAPVFMQRLSLEWLFRFLQSPGRLGKRYFMDAVRILPILAAGRNK